MKARLELNSYGRAARQHSGALIGRALYLPAACAADEEHGELADIPGEVGPAPVPLRRLIAVAQARWRIEEDQRLAKQGRRPGLGSGDSVEVLASLEHYLAACLHLPRRHRRLPCSWHRPGQRSWPDPRRRP